MRSILMERAAQARSCVPAPDEIRGVLKTKSSLALAVMVAAFWSLSVSATAATEDELVDFLLQETEQSLEIDIDNAQLLANLQSDLEYALELELLDEDILEEANSILDGETEESLDNLLDENLEEQETSWLDLDPALLSAFDLVKYEFHACRAATTGPANICAQGLGFKLQVASVEISLSEIEAKRLELESLSDEERGLAEAELAKLEIELLSKLARAKAKLERFGSSPEAEELAAAVATVESSEAVLDPITSSTNGNGNQNGSGNSGNGNSGNSGNNGNSGNGNSENPGNGGNNGNSGNGNSGNSGNNGNNGNRGASD